MLNSEGEWDDYMDRVTNTLGNRKIICLEGEMGTGKTTFCKKFCAHLGSNDIVQSPTFGLIHQYTYGEGNNDLTIYHLDLFRLESLQEILDIGIMEILDSGAFCLIEWPKRIYPVMDDYAIMLISIVKNSKRKVTFN